MNAYRQSDLVIIECDGCALQGTVLLASQNGKSLALGFNGVLGCHDGLMPVLLCDDGVYRSIVNGAEVRLTPARVH
jgi:hypothetical protein